MEALYDQGLAKHIGVANYNCQSLRDLLNYARIKPSVLQVEERKNE
jgi:D-xylose reductase